MDIRKSLKATQAATFAVLMPDVEREGMPTPTGTGFFVSPDGLFVTARHVVVDGSGAVRADVGDAWLQKERRDLSESSRLCQHPEILFEDIRTDIAVLRVPFERNREKDWMKSRSGFPFLSIARRSLDEGEPVYSFGYPLPDADFRQGEGFVLATTTLRPRVTSAIVSATTEEYGPVRTSADPIHYVLDKALNYGNSGGPIVSTATGHVHAVCTRFQPVMIPQQHLGSALAPDIAVVMIPSLYGVTSALSNPAVTTFLRESGAAFA